MATKGKGKSKARKPRVEKIGDDGLTNRQRAFVNHYLSTWNATDAAIKAGYSKRSARSIGSENLTKPDIRALIEQQLTQLTMSANEVLARLTDQAHGTLADFVTNAHLDFDKARKAGKMHLLKSFSVSKEGFRIELYDAQAALRDLGRHHSLFKDVIEMEEPITIRLDR